MKIINFAWTVFVVSLLFMIINFSKESSLKNQSNTFYGFGIALIISIILIIIDFLTNKK